MKVDAVADDESVLAEIFARQGRLKGSQQKKVGIDALKLITVARMPQTNAAAYALRPGPS